MDTLHFEDYSKSEKKKKLIYAAVAVLGVVCIVGALAVFSNPENNLVL
jgi:succinate dehydrogenase hydrophobic anchor subunit